MLIIYKPEGGERQEWEFNPDEAWSFEAELIESVGPPTWVSYEGDFLALLRAENSKAKRALLWVLLRRDKPELRFVDLVVKVHEVALAMDRGERDDLRKRIEAGEFSDTQRALAEEMLADFPDEPEPEVEPVGKDEPADDATNLP